jgi:hypothetical protein
VKGILAVDVPARPRFELALDQLRGGLGFCFNDVWFTRDQPETLCCEAVDQGIQRSTEAAARAHIDRARRSLAALREASAALDELASSHSLRFAVVQDLGNGTIEICREESGVLEWSHA